MATILTILIVTSVVIALEWLPGPAKTPTHVLVGIETGWNSNFTDCKILIDKVKSYTNLFIIASPLILSDEALLNSTCDYAFMAGMYFMPAYYHQDLFNSTVNNASSNSYIPSIWFTSAKERYGDKLLGIYFYDEPGGTQLDQTVNLTSNRIFNATHPPSSYRDYADWYTRIWTQGNGVPEAAKLTGSLNSSLFTSDYALYWFDYKLGYNTILAQFGWNNSRALQVSLVRGAAEAQHKDWGVIVTWTYNDSLSNRYLESGPQMYQDMVLAFKSGANYVAVYDSSQNYKNSTLNQEHYKALNDFWIYMQQNPDQHGSLKAHTSIVLPRDYGFGFRSSSDSVWQYHQEDIWTKKLYGDIAELVNKYNYAMDIVYNDNALNYSIGEYRSISYWPKDFGTNNHFPVIDLNNEFGFNTVKEALVSYSTYPEDTLLVKPENYTEIFETTKPFVLTSQDNDTVMIQRTNTIVQLTITSGYITIDVG